MSNRFYCPSCGEHSLVRDFMKAYYVEFNKQTNKIEYTESEYEPEIEDSSTKMYCEVCWDFIKLEEIEDQIKEYKLEKSLVTCDECNDHTTLKEFNGSMYCDECYEQTMFDYGYGKEIKLKEKETNK
jgi:predicted RNA-binding Zn-ribbon protein involved in translation (DUF1610 family)